MDADARDTSRAKAFGAAVARGQPPARPYPTPRGTSKPAKHRRKRRDYSPPAAILRAGRKKPRCGLRGNNESSP